MIISGLIINAPRSTALESFNLFPTSMDYVLIKVEACGLCTWEQRVYRGVKPTYPFWGGHEISGTIEAVNGKKTENFTVGDRVAIALMRRCGECYYCRNRLDNHCVYVKPESVGDTPQGPRGLSDLIYVPPYKVFRLSKHTSSIAGALVEPVACVLRSIDKGNITLGSTAVVIGSGTMGLLHAKLLKMIGCNVVLCGEDSDNSRALATNADVILSLTKDNIQQAILDITGGYGANAVFCTRGGVSAIDLGVKITGRAGRVVLYQSIRDSDVAQLKMNELHYREIEIVGTISQSITDFQRAAELISNHVRLFDFLTTEVINADLGTLAFDTALDPNINRVFVTFN